MPSSIVERLGEFMKHKGLNYSDLAKLLKYNSSEKISRLFREEGAKPSADIIEDISKKFENELNVSWFITGDGKMLKEMDLLLKEPYAPAYSRKRLKEEQNILPVIDLRAAANYTSGYTADGYIEKLDKIILPTSLIGYKKHYVFQVIGDSMHPTLYDSDYVASAFVDPGEWTNARDNYIYVVVSKHRGISIKRIKNRLRDSAFIRCRSDNRHHPPFNVDFNDLLQLWMVTCKLSFNLPNENENLYNKIEWLEERVEKLETENKKLTIKK